MGQCGDLDSQLDALAKHAIEREKIFSEKISTRIKVRPAFEEALKTAREIKAHAPHCRVLLTVYEMKRLGRDAAELTALADHLTEHGLVLEMLAGPLPGIYDPTGPGKLLFGFFAAHVPRIPGRWDSPSVAGTPAFTPNRRRAYLTASERATSLRLGR
ncbi:recombinase family protein [Streptomyces sp. PSRA5]|uniref:recombinase family protein n=1 Tax=Streptomyces panacea TaxID=3035064 RepID=UPI00339BD919